MPAILIVCAAIVLAGGCQAGSASGGGESRAIVDRGKPIGLRSDASLGEMLGSDGYLTVRSARPASNAAFGAHYDSIALLGDALLAAGDFDVTMKLGLRRTDGRGSTLPVSVLIGTHYYDLTFDEGSVTVQGVRLDSTRYDTIGILHAAPVSLDGKPFTLSFVRKDGQLAVGVNGETIQRFWVEPSGGRVAFFVERDNLFRVTDKPDIEAELRLYDWRVAGRLIAPSEERKHWEKLAGDAIQMMKRVGNAYGYVEDDPELPNVLLIGDSISIYYTDPVRRLLAGQADVYRTPMGPGKAETLFKSLDEFLSWKKWDVIHFNSGLHDFANKQGTPEDVAQYRKNLEIIVGKLEATGAKLIWASTTPVPPKAPSTTSNALAIKYNAAAREVMDAHHIPIDDLYSLVLPNHDKYWLGPNNVHFNELGSAVLGRQVANVVLQRLGKAPATAATPTPQMAGGD